MSDKINILVTGDLCVDWNIATTRRTDQHNLWQNDDEWTAENTETGCAALLGELIKKVVEGKATANCPISIIEQKDNETIDHLFSLWRKYDSAWRIETHLGKKPRKKYDNDEYLKRIYTSLYKDNGFADILVIDDKTFYFRGHKEYWPKFDEAKYILMRMAKPLCKDKLWEQLSKTDGPSLAKKLVVVFTANDLRDASVRVSRELSWESTIEDVIQALKKFDDLKKCCMVVVSFDSAGVLFYSPGPEKWSLIYDPRFLESETTGNNHGRMNGYSYCLIAALVNGYVECDDRENYFKAQYGSLTLAAKKGIAAQKRLFEKGYHFDEVIAQGRNDGKFIYYKLCFPHETISGDIRNEIDGDRKIEIENILKGLIETNNIHDGEIKLACNVEEIPKNILVNGEKPALIEIPYQIYGDDYFVVDRYEIEGLRSIGNLVNEYVKKNKQAGKGESKPLSVAVFGTPGSGKSFVIKKLASSLKVSLGLEIEVLEFNLSQFSSPEALVGAFHQVRDCVLKGKLPFVFWDEFDSNLNGKELGWLRYFLAPMQDGHFQEGQATHSIGTCVFVFAGGTSSTYRDFAGLDSDKPRRLFVFGTRSSFIKNAFHNKSMNIDDSKKTDFLSRLKGHVEIAGINLTNDPKKDKMVTIRRALLLKSLLRRNAPSIVVHEPIDAVFLAFLRIKNYSHGARSMESIISMSRLAGEIKFSPSALPPFEQLNMHVDAREFMEITRKAK